MKMKYFKSSVLLTGYVLSFADDDLSKDKVATQSTTAVAPIDDPNRYEAGNAVDRNITTCMRTDAIGVNSHDQTVWWKVDLGGAYSIYSVNILFKNYDEYSIQQRGRFAGFSLYVSNSSYKESSSPCYKDGPQLPPLNLTTTCITSGHYVIFYNKRLSGVDYPSGYKEWSVYTELCEVIVQDFPVTAGTPSFLLHNTGFMIVYVDNVRFFTFACLQIPCAEGC